jgi:hypothetical protein
MLQLEMRLQSGLGQAEFCHGALGRGEHRRALPAQPVAERLRRERAAPVAESPMPLAPGRPALAAVHPAHPLAPHRRLPAGPVIVLAPCLAARRQAEIVPVAARQRSAAPGHGVGRVF